MPNEYDDLNAAPSPAAAPAPVPARNEYDDLNGAENDFQKNRLQQSLMVASGTNPDEHAKVLKASSETGLPADVVSRNLPDVQKTITAQGNDPAALIEKGPKTSDWASNPDNASLISDDMKATYEHERQVRDYSDTQGVLDGLHKGLNTLATWMHSVPQAAISIAQMPYNLMVAADRAIAPGREGAPQYANYKASDFMPEALSQGYAVQKEALKFDAASIKANPFGGAGQAISSAVKGDFVNAGRSSAAWLSEQAPILAAMIGSLGGTEVLMGAGAGVEAQERSEAAGANPAMADINFLIHGGVMVALRAESIAPGIKSWQNALVDSVGKEGAKVVTQNMIKTLAHGVGVPVVDFTAGSAAMRLSDVITGTDSHALDNPQEWLPGAAAEGLMMGAVSSAPQLFAATVKGRQATVRAETAKNFYTSLGESAEAAKLRERLPQAQKDLIRRITKDGAVQNIHVSREAFEKQFTTEEQDPAAAAQQLGWAKAYEEAKNTDAALVVPLAEWTDKIVGTPHYDGLKDDIKFGDGPSDFTVNEATAENERIAQEMKAQAEATQPMDKVEQSLTEQIKATGEPGFVASPLAQQIRSGLEGIGKLAGFDGAAIAERFGLTIKNVEEMPAPAAETTAKTEVTREETALINPLPETLQQEGVDKFKSGDSIGADPQFSGKNSYIEQERQAQLRIKEWSDQGSAAFKSLVERNREEARLGMKKLLDYAAETKFLMSPEGRAKAASVQWHEVTLVDEAGNEQVIRVYESEPGVENANQNDQSREFRAQADVERPGDREAHDEGAGQVGTPGGRPAGQLGERSQISDPRTEPLRGAPERNLAPDLIARADAETVAREVGLPFRQPDAYVEADPARALRIADAFVAMKHDPNDPEVKRCYDALIQETIAQWNVIMRRGLKVERTPKGDPPPYRTSVDMIRDVRENNHMWFFATEDGFGADKRFDDHPLNAVETGIFVGDLNMRANDLFRVVHDYFGHVKEGVAFGPNGEENAWQSHMRMFGPDAARAMTSETRGQNSWVNFHPDSEANRSIKPGSVYADQKAGLLPEWAMTEGLAPDRAMPEKLLQQAPSSVFYSQMRETLNAKMSDKATAEQVRGIIKDVKAEEREWSGIDEYLSEHPKVSKADLLSYLDANQMTINERMLTAEPSREEMAGFEAEVEKRANQEIDEELERLMEQGGINNDHFAEKNEAGAWQVYGRYADPGDIYRSQAKAEDKAQTYNEQAEAEARTQISNEIDRDGIEAAVTEDMKGEYETKFEDYTLPGGTNYRELLLKLPRYDENGQIRKFAASYKPGLDFRSGHFDDLNILAHVRMNDRVDADGKKVLFIEEIQSDWHQAGRRSGYRSVELNQASAEYENLKKEMFQKYGGTDILETMKLASSLENMQFDKALSKAISLQKIEEQGVADAPFKKTWHELALKRMLRYAAENGYDKLAWTTGEQQAARYDLSKQVDSLHYKMNPDGTFQVSAKVNHRGNMIGDAIPHDKLEEYVGKDVAKKMIDGLGEKINLSPNNEPENNWNKLQGIDLKVGGEGMKGFYDRMIPAALDKLVKKFGTKTGEVYFKTGKVIPDQNYSDAVIDQNNALRNFGINSSQWDIAHAKKEKLESELAYEVTPNPGLDLMPSLKDAAIRQGFPMFQGQEITPRGQITFEGEKAMIELFKAKDLSTILHESGHYFFKVIDTLAADAKATPEIKQLQADILKWFGIENISQINDGHKEKFAEAYETYAMEGRAPSEELRPLFVRFKVWLTQVYQQLRNRVPLDDQIRDIFDRMLTGQDAAARAEKAQGLEPMFKDAASAGMTEEKFAAYTKAVAEARQYSEEKLTAQLLKQFRREQRQADAVKREDFRVQFDAQVGQQPLYKAIDRLQSDKEVDRLLKIDRAQVPADLQDRMPAGTLVDEGGISPYLAADMLGYKDGYSMMNDMVNATPKDKVVKDMVDQAMAQERQDPITLGTLPKEAIKALHNDKQAYKLRLELEHLASQNLPVFKEGIRQLAKRPLPDETMKAQAQAVIDGKAVRDINPSTYQRAELKTAREAAAAFTKGDFQAAIAAKRRESLNHALFAAATKAQETVDRGVNYLKKFDKPTVREKIDLEYRDQIDALLDRYDIRKSVSNRALDKKASLASFVERMSSAGYQPNVPEKLLNELTRTHYKDMPLGEFSGLVDAIKSIESLGRMKTELLDGREKRQINELAAEATMTMATLPQRDKETNRGLTRMDAAMLKMKSSGRSLQGALLKMEQMFDWLDNRNPNGVLNRVVFRRISDAGVRQADLQKLVKGKIDELVAANLDEVTKDKGRIYEADNLIDSATGQKQKFTKKEMLALAGNMGNESNTAKLVKGEKWKESDVWDFLHKNMVKEDWDFVAGLGRTMESLWPQKLAMSRRLGNSNPEKIQPRPFETPHGTYEGWYWPMVYDPARSQDVAERGARKDDALFENIYSKANTDTGRMNTRVEAYARPLLLSLESIPRVINDEIHDIAYHEAILDADKFLSHEQVRQSIISALSQEHYDQIRPWLQSIANDRKVDMQALKWFDQLAQGARTRATIVGLGYRLSTIMVHGSSAAMESVAELGPKWFSSGLKDFANPKTWQANVDFIFERSGEMRNRMNEVDRDIRDHLKQIDQRSMDTTTSAIVRGADAFKAHAYQGIAMLDMASALPTWKGAYLKALSPASDGGLDMTEENAVYYADKTVRNAHGGTGVKDLAAIQRGSEFQKLFTMFYSFWNHNVNRLMDTSRLAMDKNTWRDTNKASMVTMRLLVYTLGIQAMHSLVHKPAKGEDQEEGWLKWAAKEFTAAAFSGIPILRDIASHFLTGRDYSVTPAAQMVTAVGQTGQDAANAMMGKEVSNRWLKNAITTSGYALNLPTGQAASAAQYIWDVEHGRQNPQGIADWWRGLSTGDQRKK